METNKYFAIKITNQTELKFSYKLYKFKYQIYCYEPMWVYLDENYSYISFDYESDVKDPIKEYSERDLIILDAKNLIREEKLKRINEHTQK